MRILCIGAHPDDCEGSIGGTALLLRQRGDEVTFVSVTDGSRGHYLPEYLEHPERLIQRRRVETIAATSPFGIRYANMGVPDGEVYVSPELTHEMIKLIRRAKPDLVLMNRPCDYHRDHRYTAQLILDATYMLTVPFLCPDVPALDTLPVFAYWQDRFTEVGAFRADVVVPIDSVIEQKRDMMLAHESQYLEWLPYNAGKKLPEDPSVRRTMVGMDLMRRSRLTAEAYRAEGQFAEAFQISEYGRRPSEEELQAMFPP